MGSWVFFGRVTFDTGDAFLRSISVKLFEIEIDFLKDPD